MIYGQSLVSTTTPAGKLAGVLIPPLCGGLPTTTLATQPLSVILP